MKRMFAFLACFLASSVAYTQAPPTPTFAAGLTRPVKLDTTHHGALLVTEAGNAANDGELSRVDRNGVIESLLAGLPSGTEVTGGVSGPTALLRRGCCSVDVVIGEGDVLRFTTPPKEIPNPVRSVSPIFSSVLKVVFNRPLDSSSGGFALTAADHETLADGFTVRLENDSGEKAWVRMMADLKDFRPDPIVDSRGSNPFGAALCGHFDGVLLADAGQNSIVQADLFGPPKTLLRFPPIMNPAGVFPPVSDAVPTAIRHLHGDQYLVSLLTGLPFRSGAASIRVVDIHARTQSTLISGLSTVTDVLKVRGKFYVLEISTNLSMGAPGRLLQIAHPAATPVPLASDLIGGTGIVYSHRDDAIYVAENFTGRIRRVDLD